MLMTQNALNTIICRIFGLSARRAPCGAPVQVTPQTHHSDRGVQYASSDFQRLLAHHSVRASMSAKGNCYDNAAMESFWATLKTECFHDQIPRNREHAQALLFDYIETFYNPRRLHSSLGYLSPIEFENSLFSPTNRPN